MGTTTSSDPRAHLIELVKDFNAGILVTHAPDGNFHGRPMGLAEVTDAGTIYFSTSTTDPKAHELDADSRAGVFFQSKTRWVSLSGRAVVVKDRTMIERLWEDSWKLWFPDGKDDPTLALIRFEPERGEYWDNTGIRGLRFAIEAAKALVQGRHPDVEKIDEHKKVELS